MKSLPVSFILSLLVFATGCGESQYSHEAYKTDQLEFSIINGKSIENNDPLAKSVVAIVKGFHYSKNEPQFFSHCTGVVLSADKILTAAHCAENIEKSRIVTGQDIKKSLKNEDSVYEIKKAYFQPDYKKTDTALVNNLDLAILELKRPITEISKREFSIDRADATNELLIIAGYGRASLNQSDMQSLELKKADYTDSKIVTNEGIIRIQEIEKTGLCTGDSGGPLFTQDKNNQLKLVGIAIAVEKFKNAPQKMNACYGQSVFLDLSLHIDWIKSVLENQL